MGYSNEEPSKPRLKVRQWRPLFESGDIVATDGAIMAMPEDEGLNMIMRHLAGDWGELDQPDKTANDKALQSGDRLLSTYTAHSGDKIYVITEHDRSVTTILLANEY